MKLNQFETPEEFILNLDWKEKDLEKYRSFLKEWDKRDNTYYSRNKFSTTSKKVDMAEREHYRNALSYWEKKFENKPT